MVQDGHGGTGSRSPRGQARVSADGPGTSWSTVELARLFPEVFEAAPDAILVVDASGTIVLANRQVEATFGYDREELLGETVEALVPEGLRRDHVEHRRRYMKDPERRPMGMNLDLQAVRRNGERFPVEISLSPLGTDQGLLVMAAIRDVTDRRQIEQKLREHAEELEHSNEEWERFAHVISHDLKEPIRMVNSYLQLLEERHGDQLDGDAEEFVTYAVQGARRMSHLIDGLLAYSRLDRKSGEFEPVDASEIVDEVLDGLSLRVEETGAQIEVDDLPVVRGDAAQLGQVFQNLLENALKFSGDQAPRVAIYTDREGEMARFHVEDDGVGIDPGHQERIFDIFQGSLEEDGGGRGIGLSVCKRIVERHGGDMGVESAPGEGSRFWFTLRLPEE